nr:Fic family protein [uncultured Flavobacterium sp.]
MSYEETKLKIDSLKEKVAAHGKLTDEQLKKINYKFRLEWNYTSNSMEGNTLTIDETRSVMVGNIDVHQKPYKHVAEMKGHDEVISEILKVGKGELRLSESRIKQIHTSIMYEESDEMKARVGDWKKQNNHIINRKGEKFDFTDWELIPDKIHDLLNRTNAAIDAVQHGKKKDVKHPLDIAFDFHLEYLTIHPFYDGNGRTARILTNLILISFGYPPFWITEKEKASYYAYLTDIQGYGGDRKLLDAFMADLVLRSQQLVMDAIEGKDIEEEDDVYKEITLLKKKLEAEKFTKSPNNVYEVYRAFESNVWKKIKEDLDQFEEFFSESKTKRFLNNQEEIFKSVSIIPTFKDPFERSTKPEEVKIFGHDIYETDVDEIKWVHKKYGLKKSKYPKQYEVTVQVRFSATSYDISISINLNEVLSEQFKYTFLPNSDIAKNISKLFIKMLLSSVREDISL